MSTSSSAGCPARSTACLTSGMRLVTPVEVSLCTTHTALTRWAPSARNFASIAAGSAPCRQSPGMNSTTSPSRSASLCQSVANCPVSHISTVSPGERVFASAASQAPVPEAG